MKPTFKLWAAAWWLVLLYSQASLGQTQPASCGSSGGTVPTSFASWDWEVDLTQPGYCDAWTANISINNNAEKRFMRAPWVSAASDYVMRIGTGRDYRRANGWELVRMDFGGNLRATPHPYFILYNRHTAVLRVFMYLTNQSYGKVIMTLRHGSSNAPNARNPAILAMANPLQAAPDKYQAQATASTDMMTYVCKYGAATGWIMAEYPMSFDPNVTNNPRFYESALLFEVYGITTSNVELGGSFKFTTQAQPEDGYGFSVASSQQTTNPNGTKSFLTNGAKLLGNVGSWSDQIGSFNEKAKKAVASLDRFGASGKQPLFAAWKFSKFVQKQTESKAAGTLKGIFDAAGMLGGGFSLLGSVIGTLWPDAAQAAAPVTVAPTISSGTITLTGTIETSVRLGFISLQIPGTPHNFDGATNGPARTYQPYYDCPMGLFNLTATPRLETITYQREADNYTNPWDFYQADYNSIEAKSYGPMPLQFAYNRAAGIEVVSVKAAIMQKVPYNDLVDLDKRMTGFSRFNFVRAQVEAGALEADPYDTGDPNTDDPTDDTFLVHTPFVEAGCFSQVAYNAYSVDLAASPVFVRVIAVLRRTGADASAPPIYFVQDYAAETFPSTTTRRFPQLLIHGIMCSSTSQRHLVFTRKDTRLPPER